MKKLFELRGKLPPKTNAIIGIAGFIIFILLWHFTIIIGNIPKTILPSPLSVLLAFKELYFDDNLFTNMWMSIKINYMGYTYAILFALPLAYLIGLFPLFNALLFKYIDAIRFLPLTACTGIFMVWFGMYDGMKIKFLAFGIFVYLDRKSVV